MNCLLPKAKYLLRNAIPPIVWRMAQKHLRKKRPSYCGLYKTYREIPQENQWESNLWIKQQKTALELSDQAWSYLPRINHPRDLTALYLNQLSWRNKIRVIDFGGASGETYYQMVRSGGLLYPENIVWLVVDAPNLLELGEKFKNEKEQITFLSEMPDGKKYDVLHISTVLQYIEDIEALVEKLINTATPSHIILTRLLGGATNSEYFTKNFAFGRCCPVHIFNIKELSNLIEKHGFHLEYRATNIAEKLSPESYSGVPPELQIYNTSHLFFARQL